MVLEELRLKERFHEVRQRTEDLCSPLTPEDHVVQPVVDVSPPKWHLGHTTWFFETFILIPEMRGYKVFDDNYNFLFNSYYETVGARVIRTNRGNLTRPTVKDVLRYRQYVNDHIAKFLDSAEINPTLAGLFELGLQHEQQHQELLCYDIKYILGNNPIFPVYIEKELPNFEEPDALEFIQVESGLYEIGHSTDGFCFDNELGVHNVYLHGYGLMNRLTTNEEYLEFINDQGYNNFKYWLSEGWEWVNSNNIKAPAYWHSVDGQWHEYSLNGGLKPLDLYAPVTHVSFFEADAFAKWRGLRLPTEFEWEIACRRHLDFNENSNFLEAESFQPVGQTKGNNQLYGDVWEWTNSAYLPYPFYEAPEGAVGEYNGKFMINQMVLRGGSCVTPKNHIRTTYRNFFHPNLRWMFSGIRLAQNI